MKIELTLNEARVIQDACAGLDAIWVIRAVIRICVSNLVKMEIGSVS